MLEFNDWREAKPWSYVASYGLLDGFEACGAEWTVLPSLLIWGDRSLNPFIDARERLLEAETYDQVWVWLTHAHYPPDFWPWVKRIAPVRVGILMESLRYTAEELASWEGYGWRFDAAVEQASYLTHLVTYDEQDGVELAAVTGLPTHMCHGMVPERSVRDLPAPVDGKVIFLGTLYDKRLEFLAKADLGDRVRMLGTPETGTGLQAEFDALTKQALDDLRAGTMTPEALRAFILGLKDIRERILEGVMDVYRDGLAILNLPAYFKGFPGRVVEALAAGVPIVTNRLDGRPESSAMLSQGEHLIYYDASDPADLARQLDMLIPNQALRDRLVANGRDRLRQHLTSEAQMAVLQAWIDRTSGSWLGRLLKWRNSKI
jgi:glycosyltransferase involved in cell wall biosynthesis